MTAQELHTGERPGYWLSLAALIVVLPVAVLVHSWGSLSQWWANRDRDPIIAERGVAQSYAGAEWRLTGLSVLPQGTGSRTRGARRIRGEGRGSGGTFWKALALSR